MPTLNVNFSSLGRGLVPNVFSAALSRFPRSCNVLLLSVRTLTHVPTTIVEIVTYPAGIYSAFFLQPREGWDLSDLVCMHCMDPEHSKG